MHSSGQIKKQGGATTKSLRPAFLLFVIAVDNINNKHHL